MLDTTATLLRARASNWGRWSRSDSTNQGHCASAEYRYVAPRPDSDAVAATATKVDVADAEQFERAVCGLKFPMDRAFLLAMYRDRCSRSEIARKFKIPFGLVDAFHHRVLGALQYRIERLQPRVLHSPKRGLIVRPTI